MTNNWGGNYGDVAKPPAGDPTFDGMYYVDSVTHTLKPGEYKQSFVLKRNALIANLPVVPTLPY